MGKKYICEVKKDNSDMSLKLVHAKDYPINSKSEVGEIQFNTQYGFDKYFEDNCISEDELKNNGSIFMLLFWLLLFIFIIVIIVQLVMNGTKSSTGGGGTAKFGSRFNF